MEKHHILVVDDEMDSLQLLEGTFRREYQVLLAQSGFEGLKLLNLYIGNCLIS